MIKKGVIFFSLLLLQLAGFSQTTLNEMIEAAQMNSYASQLSKKDMQLADLTYVAYKLNYKPSLSIYGNIPGFNKDKYAVTQPDGSVRFLSRSQNYSSVGIGFSQPIPFTGGTISVNTDLYRFDDFAAKSKQYNGTPVFVRFAQPLFKYNAYRWDKQIAPLKLQIANQEMKASMMQLDYDVCQLYFDIIEAQINEQLAISNLQNCTVNLVIENRRVQLGASTEDKVLLLEIQQVNNQQQQAAAQLNIRKAFLALQTYLNSGDTTIKQLQLPQQLPSVIFDKEKIIASARQNLPQYLSFQQKKLEARSNTAKAKAGGRQIDLIVSYGLNNAGTDIPAIYQHPQDQQRFSIGFNIPVMDWGKRKNSVSAAMIREEQIEIINKQDEARLINEITDLTNQLAFLRYNVQQALLSDTLSQKRFAITNRLFQSGKASLLELQAAQTEKDIARRKYIATLRMFWESYYLLRLKAVFDF